MPTLDPTLADLDAADREISAYVQELNGALRSGEAGERTADRLGAMGKALDQLNPIRKSLSTERGASRRNERPGALYDLSWENGAPGLS